MARRGGCKLGDQAPLSDRVGVDGVPRAATAELRGGSRRLHDGYMSCRAARDGYMTVT